LRFETDNDFHFEYFLAEKLGCLVADLRTRITAQEYLNWSIYYGRRAQQRQLANMSARR
jgi:hypothetical protein